jgi:hypothetical protein
MSNIKAKQHISYIAHILLVTILISTIFSSNRINIVSPQIGKYIEVGVFCENTQQPVPSGLAVTVEGQQFSETLYTQADGFTNKFGSGLVDGTYTISFYWGQQYSYEVTIDCSKITWTYTYYVPNPTIIKHFVYELDGQPTINGLAVDLTLSDGSVVASSTTDASGTVVFDGSVVNVGVDYYLAWAWGSAPATEGPISFVYVDGQLLSTVVELTNQLEPKI